MVVPTSCFARGEKTLQRRFSLKNDSSDGVLAELAAQTGEASKERLLEIARTAYFRWTPKFLLD